MSCTLARGGTSVADRSAPSSHRRPYHIHLVVQPPGAPPCSHHHHRWKRRRWRRTVLASVSRPACPDQRRAVQAVQACSRDLRIHSAHSHPCSTSTNTLAISTCPSVAAQYTGSVPLLSGAFVSTQLRQRTHALRLPPLCRHVDGPPSQIVLCLDINASSNQALDLRDVAQCRCLHQLVDHSGTS
jgi:hypothetical protein